MIPREEDMPLTAVSDTSSLSQAWAPCWGRVSWNTLCTWLGKRVVIRARQTRPGAFSRFLVLIHNLFCCDVCVCCGALRVSKFFVWCQSGPYLQGPPGQADKGVGRDTLPPCWCI